MPTRPAKTGRGKDINDVYIVLDELLHALEHFDQTLREMLDLFIDSVVEIKPAP